MRTKIEGCDIISISTHSDHRGELAFLEAGKDLGFPIKRVYWLYNIKEQRGGHAHKNLIQLYLCLSGSIDIILDDGTLTETITLNSPNKGLYINTLVWREVKSRSPESTLLVLASENYLEEDYIRDYEEFKEWTSPF